jgi:hypothetical protein
MQNQITPEIIIFYLDLGNKILKRKYIFKALENFISEKKKKIPNSTFCAFYYKQGDVPFLTEETQEKNILLNELKKDWKERETSKSFFENGLFYCLSFLAEKATKKAGNYRIIVLSDTPSQKSSEYAEALMGLVETVRNFPTFIDIIRIGESDLYPDDVKLRIISTITSGGLFYVEEPKGFQSTLLGLAKNKTLPDLREEGGQVIDDDKKAYYEQMAKSLETPPTQIVAECIICNQRKCKYCEEDSDLLKCSHCETIYHGCCAGLYSWKYNIGLKHVFRCMQCQGLVKMDETFVYEINGETPPSIDTPMTIEELEASTKEEETWQPDSVNEEMPPKEDQIAQKLDPPVSETAAPLQQGEKKVQKVRMGLFGPIHAKKTPSTTNNSDTQAKPFEKSEAEKPKAKIKPAKVQSAPSSVLANRRRTGTRRSRSGIKMCSVCSTRLRPTDKTCPNCGSPAPK